MDMLFCIALPGHKKHTNETKINCDSGEAYHGILMGPNFRLLYFHPLGNSTSVGSTVYAGDCVVGVVGPFLASAMWYWGRASTCYWSKVAIDTSIAPRK